MMEIQSYDSIIDEKLYWSEDGKQSFTGWYIKLMYGMTVDMNVEGIRFSQNSISPIFQDGESLEKGIKDIKYGKWKPVIEVTTPSGGKGLYTLDNRRLYCTKAAGVRKIRVRFVKYQSSKHRWKFTSNNEGDYVDVTRINCKYDEEVTKDEFEELENSSEINGDFIL